MTSARCLGRAARLGVALLSLVSFARAAQSASAQAPPATDAAAEGALVLLGESFVLPADLCRELVASSRAGECLRIRPSCCAADAVPDPLAACVPAREPTLLDPSARHSGDDRTLCERARSAGSIVLIGGTYLDWYGLLLPSEKRSGLALALTDARRSGALVIASGAAASFLAEWAVVDRAALNRLRRNPRDESEHTLVRGLGLVPGLTIDASGAPKGSVARLLALAAQGPSEIALYLEGPVAWIARETSNGITDIRGSGATFVFDLHAARLQHRTLRGGRMAVLSDGDRWNSRERTAPTATLGLDPRATTAPLDPSGSLPLDAAALRREIALWFSPTSTTTSTFVVAPLKLELTADSVTRFGRKTPETGAESKSCAGIAFDVTWNGP